MLSCVFVVDGNNWPDISLTRHGYLSVEADGSVQAKGEIIPIFDRPTAGDELNEALCKRKSAYLLVLYFRVHLT